VKSRIVLMLALALALLAAPLAVEAQQAGKVWRIGFVSGSSRESTEPLLASFRERLLILGYAEGQNMRMEVRYAAAQVERLDALVAELLTTNLDLLVTATTPATEAAKRATTTLPIVMVSVGDPVATGLVPSLARPGGNLTGVALHVGGQELLGKRLELLNELMLGRLTRVAVLYNPSNASNREGLRQIEAVARAHRVTLQKVEVRQPSDLPVALPRTIQGRPDCLYVVEEAVTVTGRKQIIDFAARYRVPAIYGLRRDVEAGGLMSYGANQAELYRQAADYVDRILRGAKPAELPVQQPRTFEFLINLKTAKALGLTIPPALLLRADEVIQ
jgi:putative ABC transport system substrate-binding protein